MARVAAGRSVVVLALLLAWAGAHADETPEDKAKAYYKEGLEQYEKKRYPEAIEAFKKSYALSEKPRLLFNIAQAHRLNGACKEALEYYREFLAAEPKSSVSAEVQQRISEMEACLRPKPEPEREREPEPASDAFPPPSPPTRSDDPGQSKRTAGLITAGVGIVLVGTAVYFGLRAADAADRVNTRFDEGGEWTQEYQDIEAQGQGDETLAWVLGGGGVAAIAVGAALYVWGARQDDVGVAVVPGGAAVRWAVSF